MDKTLKRYDPSVRHRAMIEQMIVRQTVLELIEHGFELAVFDGEEDHPWTTNKRKLHDQLIETDEDYLNVRKKGEARAFGWVRFVYGNDGWDVINDYTTNLEPYLVKTQAMVDKIESGNYAIKVR